MSVSVVSTEYADEYIVRCYARTLADPMMAKFGIQIYVVLIIGTISHAWERWKLAGSCKQLHLLCLPDPWNLPSTAFFYSVDSKAP